MHWHAAAMQPGKREAERRKKWSSSLMRGLLISHSEMRDNIGMQDIYIGAARAGGREESN
jgi:hypothetical protein